MRLLLDTNVLVWVGTDDPKLPPHVADRLFDADSALFVSAVTAWEFADLQLRRRLPHDISLAAIVEVLDGSLLDFPVGCYQRAATLPDIHRDPIDRMVVAHALVEGLALVTGDEKMRRYPVDCVW
jgi:PIN domain nuclease of toxin-antitoxin system